MTTIAQEWQPVRLPPHPMALAGDTLDDEPATDALPPHPAVEPPEPSPPVDEGPTDTVAPVGTSHAFSWHGEQFAFGAKWLAFHRPSRRAIREAFREANATHWLSIKTEHGVQLGVYDLPGETGKLYSAAEAARERFGGDFIGAFQFQSDSLPDGYWLIALSEDVVICDAIYPDAETTQAVFANLTAERSFGTTCAPEAIAPGANSDIVLADFLTVAGKPLATRASRIRAIAASALLLALVTGLATVGVDLPKHLNFLSVNAANVAEPVPAAPTPTYPNIVPLPEFALSCEAAVAQAMFGPVEPWSFTSATCVPGSVVLQFQSYPTASTRRLQELYPTVNFELATGTATATVPLSSLIQETSNLLAGEGAVHQLRELLAIIDPQFQFWPERTATPEQPFDTHQFSVDTGITVPVLLDSFAALPGTEFSRVTFDVNDLHWQVEGKFHVFTN